MGPERHHPQHTASVRTRSPDRPPSTDAVGVLQGARPRRHEHRDDARQRQHAGRFLVSHRRDPGQIHPTLLGATACGGTTSIVDFAIRTRGASTIEGLDAWHAKADGSAEIDYAFHMIVTDLPGERVPELRRLADEGVTSYKLFMADPGVLLADDATIFRAMRKAGEDGTLVCMHAENGVVIDELVKLALAAGRVDPKYHARGEATPWRRSQRTLSGSGPPIRSGWPRGPRPTRSTTSAARSRRAGAGWSGRRWPRRPAARQRQRPALRRGLGRRSAGGRHQQHRAHHRPAPGAEPARAGCRRPPGCRSSSSSRRTLPTSATRPARPGREAPTR